MGFPSEQKFLLTNPDLKDEICWCLSPFQVIFFKILIYKISSYSKIFVKSLIIFITFFKTRLHLLYFNPTKIH